MFKELPIGTTWCLVVFWECLIYYWLGISTSHYLLLNSGGLKLGWTPWHPIFPNLSLVRSWLIFLCIPPPLPGETGAIELRALAKGWTGSCFPSLSFHTFPTIGPGLLHLMYLIITPYVWNGAQKAVLPAGLSNLIELGCWRRISRIWSYPPRRLLWS